MGVKTRVGIIGVGGFAVFGHVPGLRGLDGTEIVAVSRRDPEKLAIAKRVLGVPEAYTDWREMLRQSGLDAVIVATPSHVHAAPTIEALDAGLHVLVEKPMALTTKDAAAMNEAAARSGRVLMVGYGFRLRDDLKAAYHELRAGAIGQLRQATLTFSGYRRWLIWEAQATPPALRDFVRQNTGMPDEFFGNWSLAESYQRDPRRSGGQMFVDLGTHMVDAALWLLGAPPTEVVAFSDQVANPVECFMNVQARLANGVLLSIASADVVAKDYVGWLSNRLVVVGEEGTMVFDQRTGVTVIRDGEERSIMAEAKWNSVDAAFIDLVARGGQNPIPGTDAIHAVALTEAAYRSIAERQVIKIA